MWVLGEPPPCCDSWGQPGLGQSQAGAEPWAQAFPLRLLLMLRVTQPQVEKVIVTVVLQSHLQPMP